MSRKIYGKLAITNLKNNRKTYVPYILMAVLSVMMYYIVGGMAQGNNGLSQNVKMIMGYMNGMLMIFSVIFLFYTNSFLIKRRKREIGIYNILGMGKGHIAKMLAIEAVITAFISIFGGIQRKEGCVMYVELKNINKTFGDYKASDNVNFGIEKGKLIGLLGPSGSGKTTILRMIAGLENPDSGEIVIDGKVVNDIPASKRGIGFVFQNYALFRYMTVFDNIAFGLKIQKKSKKFIKERVNELVKLIGLEGLEKRYPSQLSGGQKQRVAFARALAPNPNLLLLDEPFAAIDAKVRQELRSWLKDMIERLGVTSIFVTHDQSEAIEVADEIIITNKGRIEQIGSPIDIYQHPETAFSASFFGQTTTLDDYTKFKTFDVVDNVDRAVIRPEFVKVTKLSETTAQKASVSVGEVIKTSFRGDNIEIAVKCDGGTVYAYRGLDETPITVGEKVNVFLYRLFITKGDEVQVLRNKSLQEESVII